MAPPNPPPGAAADTPPTPPDSTPSSPPNEKSSPTEEEDSTAASAPAPPAAVEGETVADNSATTETPTEEASKEEEKKVAVEKKAKELVLPKWFLDSNVVLAEQFLASPPKVAPYDPKNPPVVKAGDEIAEPSLSDKAAEKPKDDDASSDKVTKKADEAPSDLVYHIHQDLYAEAQDVILYDLQNNGAVAAGSSKSSKSYSGWANTATFLLQCPKQGAQEFLDTTVHRLACDAGADVVSVDLEGLEDLGHHFWAATGEFSEEPIATPHHFVKTYFDREECDCKTTGCRILAGRNAVSAILTAADTKRATDSTVAKAPTGANSTSTDSSLTEPMSKENSTSTDTTSPPLIVHLRDVEKFDELKSVYIAFRDALKAKREEGRSVILIATAVSSSTSYSGTRTYAMDRVWDNLPIRAFTAVNVSPRPTKDVVAALKKFNDQEPLQTTWRHLRRSLRYALAPDLSTADVLSPWADWGDDHPKVDGFKAAMDKWTAEMAHNLARQIGTRARRNEGRIQKEDIFEIMARMSRNKDVLNRWGEDTEEEAAKEEGSEGEKRKSRKEEALDKIRDDCTSDERNYFDCVIDTDAIGATSESIRVDPDVADSLKQLLAIRKGKPYGLLATESVNGAILYGPPGTGKTHLARVLAKEASMNLIVATPADIQDCYVGRTEQKIKAMFSLAVKLAPCLIFLDEGDSLFRRRESGDKAWVRNQLGQFLMEMDGLCKLSTPPFLLIATNRPADIDDAIYRRLPHMLHMGLPNAADRKAIFDIYLKEEQVGDDVDVAALANNSTKGFSGSDVRTLCVQAALAAQREIDLLELQKKLEADGAAVGTKADEPATATAPAAAAPAAATDPMDIFAAAAKAAIASFEKKDDNTSGAALEKKDDTTPDAAAEKKDEDSAEKKEDEPSDKKTEDVTAEKKTGDVEPPKRTIRKVHFDKALARTMPTVTREALLEIQKFTNNQKRARC